MSLEIGTKRLAQSDPNTWVALGHPRPATSTAAPAPYIAYVGNPPPPSDANDFVPLYYRARLLSHAWNQPMEYVRILQACGSNSGTCRLTMQRQSPFTSSLSRWWPGSDVLAGIGSCSRGSFPIWDSPPTSRRRARALSRFLARWMRPSWRPCRPRRSRPSASSPSDRLIASRRRWSRQLPSPLQDVQGREPPTIRCLPTHTATAGARAGVGAITSVEPMATVGTVPGPGAVAGTTAAGNRSGRFRLW